MSNDKGDEALSFEEAYNRLDETVRRLEEGGLSLADATRLFEEGMHLARICNELLTSAEMRITSLQTAYGEQMRMLADAQEEGVED